MQFLRRGADLARAAADIVIDENQPADAPKEPEAPEAPEAPKEPEQPKEPEPAPAAAQDEAAIRADQSAKERKRVSDVFASDASKGKERLAARLLGNPKLDADEIVAMLPDLGADASDGMLANLRQPNPDLGAGAESGATAQKASARILAAQRGMTGVPEKKD